MNPKLQKPSCPIGCRDNDELVLIGHDLLHDLPGEFTIVRCLNCGLMRTTPRPTPDTIGFYYPEDYGPYEVTKIKTDNKLEGVLKNFLRPIIKRIFNFNTTPLPNMLPGRLLEIGCASGAFLHEMAGHGWNVQGIEFSENAAKRATKLGYSVHTGQLETAPPPDEPFDLIVGWMVLEHLHDPVGGLRKLREWVKPGAMLVLSVPNAGALEFRIFKDKWYALQLPTHLWHFTPSTLERTLNLAGWKLKKIHHQRNLNNLIASCGYVLRDIGMKKVATKLIEYPGRRGKISYFLFPLAWLLSLFGQTGRMTIWASPNE